MITTVFQVCMLRLWHNKAEWVLTFVVPVIFFSIFAMIFAGRGTSGGTARLKIAIVDDVRSAESMQAVEQLKKLEAFRLYPDSVDINSKENSPTRQEAASWVRKGIINVAIVFKAGEEPDRMNDESVSNSTVEPLRENIDPNNRTNKTFAVELLSDSYDQVANQVVSAMVQRTVAAVHMQSIPPNALLTQLPAATRSTIVPAQFESSEIRPLPPVVPSQGTPSDKPIEGQVVQASHSSVIQLPSIESTDVLGANKSNPAIAMYAAGIAVMFVLFGATAASGVLLEEKENGTLERILASQLNLDQLLMGKWLYMTTIGCIQMVLMFTWGSLVHKLPLWEHWEGFVAMTIVCVGCSSSFALLLAVACRSRAQLNWVSIVVILSMSALGGSMVPRYLMSDSMKQIGMFTFNAWALEGYNKVFWRELPLKDLWPELGVLTLSGFLLLVVARCLATRWERA